MKKILSFILVMAMVLCMVPGVAFALTGTGIDGDPYLIGTADELKELRDGLNNGTIANSASVKLTADINLGGETWTPIKSFAGEFDGNGHTISNFNIVATDARGGFFNVIEAGSGERVHDLILSDVTATVGNNRFGTLANSVQGIVNRVTVKNVTVTTTHTGAWVGGMCAFMSWPWMNDCTVENLTVNADAGADLIGGFACILQKNSNMVFDNLDVKGFKVTVADTDSSGCGVGGFVVQTQRGWEYPKVINSDISGIDITAAGLVDVGGFITWPGAHTIAENCTTQGKIDVTGVTSVDCFAGGFFGNLGWNADLGQKGHKVTDCTADVDITTKLAPAGGFVGSATNSNNSSMYAEFTNCEAKGDITCVSGGTADIGGFAGDADRGVYNNCSATGTVANNGTEGAAGGFIGLFKDVTPKYDGRYPAGTRDYPVDKSTLANCAGSSNVSGTNAGKTAGLIGYVKKDTELTLNDNAYSMNLECNYEDKSSTKVVELNVIASDTEADFGSFKDTEDYTQQPAKRITITNNGTGDVTVKLVKPSNYQIDWEEAAPQPSISPDPSASPALNGIATVAAGSDEVTIPAGGQRSFTVKPVAGLGVGNHIGLIRVMDVSSGAYLASVVAKLNIYTYVPAPEAPAPTSSGSGISITYNGGNSFSTSNPTVPTGVEIDGVPVTFNGNGSNFSVGCISSDAKWVTVRWNSTSVTTNFTPDGLVECTTVSIPKTGGMSIWAAIAQFLGF